MYLKNYVIGNYKIRIAIEYAGVVDQIFVEIIIGVGIH